MAFVEALPNFRGDCHPSGFAARIAVHAALSCRRRAARLRVVGVEARSWRTSRNGGACRTMTPERRRTSGAACAICSPSSPRDQAEVMALHIVLGNSLRKFHSPPRSVEHGQEPIAAGQASAAAPPGGGMAIDLDLHPDDLLHRARRARPLSQDEQVHLEAHLRDCWTCRFVRTPGGPSTVTPMEAKAHRRIWTRWSTARCSDCEIPTGAARDARRCGRGRRDRRCDDRRRRVRWLLGQPASDCRARACPDARGGPSALRRHHLSRRSSPDRGGAPGRAGAGCPSGPGGRLAPPVARSRACGRRLALVRPPDDVETSARLFEIANRARRQGRHRGRGDGI